MRYVEVSYMGESVKLPTNTKGALPSLKQVIELLEHCAWKKITTPEFECLPEELV